MKSRSLIGVVILLAAGSMMFTGPAAASSRTVVVDDDGAQCPGAQFKAIQPAVQGAGRGGTVRVCGGIYAGDVSITKQVRLVAQFPAAPRIDCLGHGPAAADAAVVIGAIAVSGTGATVDGMVVTGGSTGITTDEDGSGYQIRRNLIEGNTNFGIELQSSGARRSTVEKNCVRDNGVTAGPGDRAGISAENGALRNAVIRGNTTVDNGEGISVAGDHPHSDISISANVLRREAMAVSGTYASDITENDIDIAGAGFVNGIVIGGGNVGLAVASNTIVGAAGAIFFTHFGFNVPNPGANVGLLVTHNTIRDGVGSGISMASPVAGTPGEVTRSVFYGNSIQRNPASGLFFSAGSDGNVLIANTSTDNLRGIFLNGAVGTLVLGNTLRDNRLIDAIDIAEPHQNTWIANDCVFDSPAGALCGASAADASATATARAAATTSPVLPPRPRVDASHWPCLRVPVWDVDPVDGGGWILITVVAPDAPSDAYCGA